MKTIGGISDLLGLLSTLSLRVVAVTIFKLSSVIGLIRELVQKTITFINNMLKLSFIIVLVPRTTHNHRSKLVIIHALVLNCVTYLMKQKIIRATFRCLILLFRVLNSFFPFKRLFSNTSTTCITSVSLHIYMNKKKNVYFEIYIFCESSDWKIHYLQFGNYSSKTKAYYSMELP
jgi:hypothetical protein